MGALACAALALSARAAQDGEASRDDLFSRAVARLQEGDKAGAYAALEAFLEGAHTQPSRAADRIAFAEHQMATIELDRGQWQQAAARAERAAAASADASTGYRSLLHSVAAEAYVDAGLTDRAAPQVERALELARENLGDESPFVVVAYTDAHLQQASLYRATGRHTDVIDVLESLREAELPKAIRPETRGTIDARLGSAWSDLVGTAPGAESRARESLERVLANPRSHPMDRFTAVTRAAYLDLLVGRHDGAAERLSSLREWMEEAGAPDLRPVERAWLAALEGRLARAEGTDVPAALVRVERAFDLLLDQWRSTPARAGGTAFLRYGRVRFVLSELVDLKLETQGVEAALASIVRAQEVGVLFEAVGGRQTSFAEVRERLTDERTGCLVFLGGKDRSHVFAFDHRRAVHAPLPGRAALAEPIRSYQREGGAQQARALAATVFPRSIETLVEEWTSVRIVGREMLFGLALEALPVVDGEALGLARATSDLPSLPLGVALQERLSHAPDASGLCLVAVPLTSAYVEEVFGPQPDLGPAREAARKLARAFPGTRRDVLIGGRATLSRITDGRLRSAFALQFLTHGLGLPGLERRAALLVSPEEGNPDGVLTAEEVDALEAPPLVLLSVCRSRDGAVRLGDADATHLGGAFLKAGAAAVVLFHEEVLLSHATQLAEGLYRGLGEGLSLAEALRRARGELASKSEAPGSEAPGSEAQRAWASAVAFGLGELALARGDLRRSRPWRSGAVVVGLLFVALLVLGRLRRLARR